AFDRHHRVAVVHHREREAGIDSPAIHEHGARAALAVIASLLRSGEVEMFAERVEQRSPCVELEVMGLTVDTERHRRARRGWWHGSRRRDSRTPCRLPNAFGFWHAAARRKS